MLLNASECVMGRRLPPGGIPTVPAFGPGLLPLAHGPNEYVGIESIVQASKMHGLAALDYLH
ncbi:MAG TPA: hypothetical protein DIT01_11115 [Lentisphaeria bacterium]|nr:hypothetical protein [Lentisphaeria bacterium]